MEASNVHNQVGIDNVQFTINIPPPDVQVFREVERLGNYYTVKLTIRNNGDFPVKNINIYDTSVGFQCDDYPSRMLPHGCVTVIGGVEPFNEGRNNFGVGEYFFTTILLTTRVH